MNKNFSFTWIVDQIKQLWLAIKRVENSGGSGTGGATNVITEDSDTVAFTGNGTAGNPLSAESVGGGTSDSTLEQARQNGNVLEGDVEFVLDKDPVKIHNTTSGGERGIDFRDDGYLDVYIDDKNTMVSIGTNSIILQSESEDGNTAISINNSEGSISASTTIPNSKGIVGNQEFDKQGDRKAFAQMSDVYDANSYSTTEIKTGGTFENENGIIKPIYRKNIFFKDFFKNLLGQDITNGLNILIGTISEFNEIVFKIENSVYSVHGSRGGVNSLDCLVYELSDSGFQGCVATLVHSQSSGRLNFKLSNPLSIEGLFPLIRECESLRITIEYTKTTD